MSPDENPHLAQPVQTFGAALESARLAVIAIHGRGGEALGILQTCQRFGLDDIAYLAPAAADNSWYPYGFMEEIHKNEPFFSNTLQRVETLMQELQEKGFDKDRVVLVGFSQGACVVSEYAIRNPGRYAGIIVFTGGVIGPPGTNWDYSGDFSSTPVVVSGSETDMWVPAERMQLTAQMMRERGAQVSEYYYSGTQHIVNNQEIKAAQSMLAATPA